MRDSTPAPHGVRVCVLTRHFVEQFTLRVGETPDLDMVNRLLADSKRIIKQQTLYKFVNGEYKPYQLLGGFWNHTAGIVMLINESHSRAVTVYTPADAYPEHPRLPHHERRGKWKGRKR